MLTIYFAAIGDKMPAWVTQGVLEYQKRLRGQIRLEIIECAAQKRGNNADIARIMQKEEDKLLSLLPSNCYKIALDRLGKPVSTLQMTDDMRKWLLDARPVAFLVGGPEGFSTHFLQQSDQTWSLSALTFAHPLVRILFAEQVYRCHSIIEGQPYHR